MPNGALEPLGGSPAAPAPRMEHRGSLGASVLGQDPETTIGKAVSMKGTLNFDRLLRIDGQFEGTLVSKGNLVIGPSGKVVGDIDGMNELVCEGTLHGNVSVERLVMRRTAVIIGDVTAKKLHMDEGTTLYGAVNVHANAPRRLDAKGSLVLTKAEQDAAKAKEDAARAAMAAEAAAKEEVALAGTMRANKKADGEGEKKSEGGEAAEAEAEAKDGKGEEGEAAAAAPAADAAPAAAAAPTAAAADASDAAADKDKGKEGDKAAEEAKE